MPATEPASSADDHACSLDQRYWDGLWQCRCGKFWHALTGDLLTWTFTDPGLRQRLREYQMGIRLGEYGSLAEAVRRTAAQGRARRDSDRERARLRWPEARAARRSAWLRHVRALILRDPCAYCGAPAAHLDHVLPLARGGTDARRNLAPACARCNIEKGNRTPEEWKAWRIARGRQWPPPRSA